MRKLIFLVFIFTFSPALVFCQVNEKIRYIGLKYEGVLLNEVLPNGIKSLGGGLITDTKDRIEFGISRFSKGKKQMLWLDKLLGRNERGIPTWEVQDVLFFSKLKSNQTLHFAAASACLRNGKPDNQLIVLADLKKKPKTYNVRKAWRVNLTKEIFESIATKGIKCEYEEP
jgi:hypothetical protein